MQHLRRWLNTKFITEYYRISQANLGFASATCLQNQIILKHKCTAVTGSAQSISYSLFTSSCCHQQLICVHFFTYLTVQFFTEAWQDKKITAHWQKDKYHSHCKNSRNGRQNSNSFKYNI